jgi:hypothetical protein
MLLQILPTPLPLALVAQLMRAVVQLATLVLTLFLALFPPLAVELAGRITLLVAPEGLVVVEVRVLLALMLAALVCLGRVMQVDLTPALPAYILPLAVAELELLGFLLLPIQHSLLMVVQVLQAQ